jgi:hypothetical protein
VSPPAQASAHATGACRRHASGTVVSSAAETLTSVEPETAPTAISTSDHATKTPATTSSRGLGRGGMQRSLLSAASHIVIFKDDVARPIVVRMDDG